METINFVISSNLNSFVSARRFPKDITVKDLKSKLELLTGAVVATMQLELRNKDNQFIAKLDNPETKLDSFKLEDEMKLRVVDASQQAGEFEDVSKVEKFELSDDAYAKRGESLRVFKMQNKMGRFDSEQQADVEAQKVEKSKHNEELVKAMSVGQRCEVSVLGQPTRRGTVMYIGEAEFKPGMWVGIKYDEPHGKNDGSVSGKRYFECMPKYGGFVKPNTIKVGDYPEILNMDEEL